MKIGGSRSREELERRVQRFLLKYRTTPHAITNRSPAEMLFGFRPTTRLDRIRPSLRRRVEEAANARKKMSEAVGRDQEFSVGDKVLVRFWYGTRRWRPGVILKREGHSTYDVQVGEQLHRRHATQLLRDVRHQGETPEIDETRENEAAMNQEPSVPRGMKTQLTLVPLPAQPEPCHEETASTPEKSSTAAATVPDAQPEQQQSPMAPRGKSNI